MIGFSSVSRILFIGNIIGTIVFLFFPQFTHAQLQIDPRCFTQAECTAARKDILGDSFSETEAQKQATKGFYQGTDTIEACGGKEIAQTFGLGFCLPASEANTTFSFGGKKSFLHIGDFIQYMYRYGVLIAGLLAVIVIIVAGIQWTASAGNSEMVKNAQKKIAGALAGLLLAVLSYVILNTINPYLVNLRLPQIWMIKEKNFAQGKWCYYQDNKLSLKTSDTFLDAKYTINGKIYTTYTPEKTAVCGSEYWIENTNGLSCFGSYCPIADGTPTLVCNDKNPAGSTLAKENFVCGKGNISGKIYHVSVGPEDDEWDDPWIPEMKIYAICADGYMFQVNSEFDTSKIGEENYSYTLSLTTASWFSDMLFSGINITSAPGECSEHGQLNGFALLALLEQDGVNTANGARLIGRGPGGTAFDLSKFPNDDVTLFNTVNPLSEVLFDNEHSETYPSLSKVDKSFLFQWEDLLLGTPFDINVSESIFEE